MINISEKNLVERAILVGIITNSQIEEQVIEYLDELAFLAETAGAVTVRRFTQKIDTPNPKTYIGSGKLEEIRQFILVNEISLVVFDDELSPSQLRRRAGRGSSPPRRRR